MPLAIRYNNGILVFGETGQIVIEAVHPDYQLVWRSLICSDRNLDVVLMRGTREQCEVMLRRVECAIALGEPLLHLVE